MIRGITIRGAVAINVITMIGIGPLITIPLVLAQLAGPLALAGWIAGALVALCDGLVWAQLGSRYPVSGGTYVYLREIFGRDRWGRLFAFLYNWQFFLSASLTISTGYIGFANYAGYLFPNVASSAALTHIVAVGVGLVTIFALYRRVTTAASFGAFLAAIAVGTLLLVALAGYSHADFHRAFTLSEPLRFGWGFVAGLGGALYITLYDYAGYSQAALVGEEVVEPRRTLPVAIIASILIVCVLYLFLQIGVLSAIPWQSLVGTNGAPAPPEAQFVASTVVARSWGFVPAAIVTVLILITAFASVYGGLLGNSRVPFAAARDGAFLPVFARLHPTGQFPHVSLLLMGALSLVACFFDLGFVIAVIGTAGILIGSIGQIAALFVLRARGEQTPFRMPLFPLPALVALAGWVLAFANTGATAMVLGVAWLILGVLAYLITARAQRAWPFAAMLAAVLVCAGAAPARAQTPFVYGATFFYERVPRDEWAAALARYKAMGINTIDLYVMWNWHEVWDGDFDFTGRTNPRRDLRYLLKLIDADGFKIILRPGPVIRNEWRNGGYPAWLLERPQYRMPLRDVLEGRYPATATLQNAHSDAAAAEWLANAAHMKYAARWLHYAIKAALPYKRDIVGIALDDDQGAYIDNDTWPAPNFHRYIGVLRAIVQRTAGTDIPLFINTYEMKVTASAPVWAWGNWYQSDAYSIGEHDRAQLEFSTGLLQTQHRPVMISEFQAGWLQGADEAYPRAADPTNTTLALHTLLQMGAHGVVNFPVQDTLDPAGWEAPWTNAFYSWDAALSVQLGAQARYTPTARFGSLIARYGDALARTHPAADAAIAYLTSAYDPARITNDDVYRIASATIEAQRGCRIMRITCALVDLRFSSVAQLAQFHTLIVPKTGVTAAYTAEVRKKLELFSARGGSVVTSARQARIPHPAAGAIPNAVLLIDNAQRYAFLDVVNYGRTPLRTKPAMVRSGRFEAAIPALEVAPRDALLLPLFVRAANTEAAHAAAAPLQARTPIPLRSGSYVAASLHGITGSNAVAYRADIYRDGYPVVVFENARIRLIVSPCAGARAFVFEDQATGRNLFTTTGGLRDAWSAPLPPSPRDYIAPYTHPMPTGTFNRCYSSAIMRHGNVAEAAFAYDAPDAPPSGAHFERSIFLASGAGEFTERVRARMTGAAQRAQQITAFATPQGTIVLSAPSAYGFYDRKINRVTLVSWEKAAVQAHTLQPGSQDAMLTLTFSPRGEATIRYGVATAKTAAQAQAALRAFANRPPSTP